LASLLLEGNKQKINRRAVTVIVNFHTQQTSEFLKSKTPLPLDRVAVIVLGGGEGKRLAPLTTSRCKPTVSFGGRYSLIDVPISHSLSSGLSQIYVIGQYLAYTLQKHLFQTYMNYGLSQNQIQLLVPEERPGNQKVWFQGTADAVRQNLKYFSDIPADYFLILSGDQLYNINFQDMIRFGLERDANMVIAAQPVNSQDARRMGLLRIKHGSSQLVDFYEKPEDQKIIDQFHVDDYTLHQLGYDPDSGKNYLGSMGIYFFKKEAMFQLLQEDPREDFGKHLIVTQMKKGGVHTYLYDGYWEDIGTIRSYYEANLAMAHPCKDPKKGLECHKETTRLITKTHNLPGARITNSKIQNALICEGCILERSEITNSVLGVRSVVGKGSVIRDTVMMGNEYYERPPSLHGLPTPVPFIGENCLISKAIIDENVCIGNGVKLTNASGVDHYDDPEGKVFVRDGIIVVPRGAVIPPNYTF
jgi:glucose-1-phosphate adenylyltransferase